MIEIMIEILSSRWCSNIVILLLLLVNALQRYQINQMIKEKRLDDVKRAC